MSKAVRTAVVLGLLGSCQAYAADIDRTAVDFTVPANIKWVRNPAGTNEQAVLFGDPSKPGPYVARVKWLPGKMSRPHFHPNDRFFAVISGTWWVGTGEKFDPESTVPVPAGSYVIHYGQQGALRRRQGRGVRDPGLGHGPGDLDACGEEVASARV